MVAEEGKTRLQTVNLLTVDGRDEEVVQTIINAEGKDWKRRKIERDKKQPEYKRGE